MEQRIVLETDRLFLREMNMDDFEALYKVLADTDIMQHYPYAKEAADSESEITHVSVIFREEYQLQTKIEAL